MTVTLKPVFYCYLCFVCRLSETTIIVICVVGAVIVIVIVIALIVCITNKQKDRVTRIRPRHRRRFADPGLFTNRCICVFAQQQW